MGWSFAIGRIFGTQVRIHVTFLLLVGWFAVAAGLRGENQALRAHVAGLEAENAALARKVELARERLESLMARLPEE